MIDSAALRATFRDLHKTGCFVIPNPWDIGSALYLCRLGFQALATTSSGLAFSRGLPDTDWAVPKDVVLTHVSEIVQSVGVPVNADFESGYSHDPEGVAENVTLCIGTGVSGLSIEDATGDPAKPLYDLPLAVERIHAARSAIDATHSGVLLTARAECFLVGHPDPLNEAIRRLQAYSDAGADVLYAPGPRSRESIRTLVQAVSPKPLNLLMGNNSDLRTADLAELGVRRVSVGSALSRAAFTGFIQAAKLIAQEGSFAGFDGIVPFAELNQFFREELKKRSQL